MGKRQELRHEAILKPPPLGRQALGKSKPTFKNERITLNIPADTDGFLSLNCSRCDQKFRLLAEDYLAEHLNHLFCPACGSRNKMNVLFSKDAQADIKTLAENLAMVNICDLIRDFESPTCTPKNVTAHTSGMFAMIPEKFPPESKDLGKIRLDCCKKEMKGHCPEKAGSIYCPFCGEIRENPTWASA